MLILVPWNKNSGIGLCARCAGNHVQAFIFKAGFVPPAVLLDFYAFASFRAGGDATCKPAKVHQLQFAKLKLIAAPKHEAFKLIWRPKLDRHTDC